MNATLSPALSRSSSFTLVAAEEACERRRLALDFAPTLPSMGTTFQSNLTPQEDSLLQRGLMTPIAAAVSGTVWGLAGGMVGIFSSPMIASLASNEGLLSPSNTEARNRLFVRLLAATAGTSAIAGGCLGATGPWLSERSRERLLAAMQITFTCGLGASIGALGGALISEGVTPVVANIWGLNGGVFTQGSAKIGASLGAIVGFLNARSAL